MSWEGKRRKPSKDSISSKVLLWFAVNPMEARVFKDSIGHTWVVPIRGHRRWSIYSLASFCTGQKLPPRGCKFSGTHGLGRTQARQFPVAQNCLTDKDMQELADGAEMTLSSVCHRHLLQPTYLSICSNYTVSVYCSQSCLLGCNQYLVEPPGSAFLTSVNTSRNYGHYESTENS